MKIIEYLFRKVIPLFLGALLFFSFVIVIVDLMMNLWNYISNGVSFAKILRIMLLYTPKAVWYSTPMAILFAVSYALSDLYANNELVAIFASGISLFKFTLPLLIFSFLLSFGLFFFDDNLVVPTYSKKVTEQEILLNKSKSLNQDKIVIISENGNVVYKADFYDNEALRLFTLYVIVRNEDNSFNSIIRADSATWSSDSGHWVLSGATQYKKTGDKTIISMPVDRELVERLIEPPETFRNNVISVEGVGSKEARVFIEHLKRAGLPYGEPLSLYYKKFSFPFILFIVVFLSIGLSGKTRKNVMLLSLASCVTAAVLFYVTQMLTMLLAKFDYISPFMGAWFPVFLFVIIAIVLMRYTRT